MSINDSFIDNKNKKEQQEKVDIKQNENEGNNQNVQEVQNDCFLKTSTNYFDKNENLSFGLTFIGRLCMTLYSFHGLFFIYNIIILYIVIIPGFLFETESLFWKIVLSAIFICFAFSCSNLLLIPTFEFLTFPYLKYKNPFSHLLSFYYIFKQKPFDFDKIVSDFPKITLFTNIFIGIMGYLYAIAYILSLARFIKFKLLLKTVFLVLNYFNYLAIILSYFLLAIFLFFKIIICQIKCCYCINANIDEENKCIKARKICNYFCIRFSRNYLFKINQYYKPISTEVKLPDINLVSYIIEPYLTNNYKDKYGNHPKINDFSHYDCSCYDLFCCFCICFQDCCCHWCSKCCNCYESCENLKEWKCYEKSCCQCFCCCKCCLCEDFCYNFGLILKLILIFVLALVFIFYDIYDSDTTAFVLFVILSVVMAILAVSFNFPSCYMNRKTFGCCNICRPKYKLDEDNGFNPKFPKILAVTRFISDMVLIIVIGVLLAAFIFLHKTQDENEREDTDYKKFLEVLPNNETINTKKLLLPNICYSSIHNLPLNLYMPFINDAYYYFKNKTEENSSLFIDNYRHLFFSDDYEIDVLGNLINNTQTVKMIQYNIINKVKKIELTILSIKGTSYARDIYLDVQLYFSSVLLSLLSTFSIVTQKESFAYNIIEYSLSIPYRIFFKYLIIDSYLKQMQDAYIENEYSFYKNVVIVGHSLGGGLAKLFGRIMKKQAISLSGPGVNAFHSLWNYEGKSENFEISAIDLVPDMDLVPRVEVSGGTIYRIICKLGVGSCHGKEASLCEVLTMCKNPNYLQYCRNISKFDEDEIESVRKSAELND